MRVPSFAQVGARFETPPIAGLERLSGEQVGIAVQEELDGLYRDRRRDQPSSRAVWRGALLKLGVEATPDEADALARAHLREFAALWQPLEGAQELLDALAESVVPTAIVSNATGPPEIFDGGLHALGWSGFFRAIVWSSRVGRRKPDAAPFLTALRKLGVSPSGRAVMIGDSEYTDVQGALDLGLTAIRVGAEAPAESRANHVKMLGELPEFLASGGWSDN